MDSLENVITVTGVATGLIAIVGTFVTHWVDAKLKEESRLRTQMISRIDLLEGKLSASSEQVSELALKVLAKIHEVQVLTLKYDALNDNHRELSERYHASEETAQKLMSQLVAFNGGRKTPESFAKVQPHHQLKKSDPPTNEGRE